MKTATDKTLKAAIKFLQAKAASGAREPGQAKAVASAVEKLREALRTNDLPKIREAIDRVARLFLR